MKFRTHIYLPYNKGLNNAVKKLRKNMTKAESKLWYQYLRCYPKRFIRQKLVGNFILDFYCASCKLAIELDGAQHETNQGIAHDQERTRILHAYGVTVIRFTNEQVDTDFGKVCIEINSNVQKLSATSEH